MRGDLLLSAASVLAMASWDASCLFAQQAVPVPVPIAAESSRYLAAVENHLDYVTEHSFDQVGSKETAMWLATIDLRTNGLPTDPLPKRLRWYRQITSPVGSNLYWDQPTIVAAYELSRRTGCACYEDAADAYLRDFLKHCVVEASGLFGWGNHLYYDVRRDEVVSFAGGFHECRPHTPAWETLWSVDEVATRRAIAAMASAHIKGPQTGLFCRHANPDARPGVIEPAEVETAMPFLEAGAVLIDSLTWLASKSERDGGALVDSALRVARYSHSHRDAATQLIRNQPIERRWDYFASTTEVGLWAGSLVRAAGRSGNEEFVQIAEAVIRPWLRLGYDHEAGKYFGALSVATGQPILREERREFAPPRYAEIFDLQTRPTHNYPMPMAETCLTLYERTKDVSYREAVERWVKQLRGSLPANGGEGAYAEDYGRAIHFLVRAGKVMERPEYRELAIECADEAMRHLYVPKMGMFRSHPGEDRCDAVDGPGVLLLALMYLESGTLHPTAFAF